MIIPENEKKLIRGLSEFVINGTKTLIKTKDDFSKLPSDYTVNVFGCAFNLEMFVEITKKFNDKQWQKLIQSSNDRIVRKYTSKEALEKLQSAIDNDKYLSTQNISIVELVSQKEKCTIKVYFTCGVYYLEGNVNQLIDQIRRVAKQNDVKVTVPCPSCSSNNVRVAAKYCLCNDCGSFSDLEENEVIEQFQPEEKQFWWAKVVAKLS